MNQVDVGILGGAFDPPHLGHLLMAASAIKADFCREVWLMPSPDRPDKKMRRPLSKRLELLEKARTQLSSALRGLVQVSEFEAKLGVFRGSLHLMRALAEAHRTRTFGFVMGEDALAQTRTWNDPVTGYSTGAEFLNSIPILSFQRAPDQAICREQKLIADIMDAHPSHKIVLTQDLNHWAKQLESEFNSALLVHFDYASLSSTRIRAELALAQPDMSFLSAALGLPVLNVLLAEPRPVQRAT